MLRALYRSSFHKSRLLQSLLLLHSSSSSSISVFNASSPRRLNIIRPDWTHSITRLHSTTCRRQQQLLNQVPNATTASITSTILPCATNAHLRPPMHPFLNGEGSWNVSWDARPARWLHRPDSAWFLFGICSCLPPVVADCNSITDVNIDILAASNDDNVIEGQDSISNDDISYKVTGSKQQLQFILLFMYVLNLCIR